MKKYINDIYKHLVLPTNKKKEIKKQLESDISIALENGETMEDIIARMGSAIEIAEDFNNSISPEDKKKMKTKKICLIVGAVIVVFVLLGLAIKHFVPSQIPLAQSTTFDESKVEEMAKLVATYVGNNDFDSLYEISDEQITSNFNSITAAIKDAKGQCAPIWGDFVSFGKIYSAEIKQSGQTFAVTQLVATYENVTITFTTTFDSNMKVCGLYLK